ncbi:P27 family phage terminase small subunit [Xanthobacteraceae bacterium A53D]
MTASPRPPRHLAAPTARWFRSVVAEFDLGDHHIHLLTLACEARDRAEQARKILEKEGVTILDRFGVPKAHPAIAIERDSRIGFARLLRELGLADGEAEAPRPPRLEYGG